MCAWRQEWTPRWWLQASHGHGVAMRHCQPDSATSSSTRGDWNEQLQVVHPPAAEKGRPHVCTIREMSSPALAAPPGHLDAFSGDCLTVRIPCSRGREANGLRIHPMSLFHQGTHHTHGGGGNIFLSQTVEVTLQILICV